MMVAGAAVAIVVDSCMRKRAEESKLAYCLCAISSRLTPHGLVSKWQACDWTRHATMNIRDCTEVAARILAILENASSDTTRRLLK